MQILRLEDKKEWDLVAKKTLKATPQTISRYGVKKMHGKDIRYLKGKQYPFQQIPNVTYRIDKSIIAIGINTDSSIYKGKNAVFASFKIQGNVSSTSKYQNGLLVEKKNLIFNELNILQYPFDILTPYILDISFARWVDQVNLEIWKYSGLNTTTTEQTLVNIQDILVQINAKQT